MSLIDHLLELYRVDGELRGLRRRLDSAKTYHEAQLRQHDEVTQRLEELQTRKRHIEAKINNLEIEGAALDEQLEKFRGDLNSAVTNKQYSAVLSELNTVKAARSKIDDAVLEQMEQMEQLQEQVAAVNAELEERGKVRDVAAGRLRQREDDVGQRVAELEVEREAAARGIPGMQLAVFNAMAEAHDGEAMANIEEINRRHREYACGACNMQLPFEQVSALMTPQSDLVRCPACGRILYLQEDVRGALMPK
jgi:predicted  nucleic acid-binding Zn-ribbon protein